MPQNTKAPTFIKETLLKLKSHSKPQILIVGDLNIPLLTIDRSSRQNLNIREIMKPKEAMIQVALIDIYKTFHLNTK